MILTVMLACVSLTCAAFANNTAQFLIASLFIGIGSVAVQMIIPLVAHLAPENSRGRIVGSVMSGLVMGILLARPTSSLITDHFGWRAVFATGASFMAIIMILLFSILPKRQPPHKTPYLQLLKSLSVLLCTMPVLRHRAFYQACMFASFSLFWSAVPLELATHYNFTQTQIAIFALVGAVGAIAAPISGRLADAGYTGIATRCALLGGAVAMFLTVFEAQVGFIGLALAGVLLDFLCADEHCSRQRAIYALDPASRSRLNGLYMASIFIGGAMGSALASLLYTNGGWIQVAYSGMAFPLLALMIFTIKSFLLRANNPQ